MMGIAECQNDFLLAQSWMEVKAAPPKKNVLGVIPARWKSSRFPGKPLELIGDKPMIWHVYQRCIESKIFTKILIATDSKEIYQLCNHLSLNVEMTSDKHQDCLDRVAEVSSWHPYDVVVCVQGDEPFMPPTAIRDVTQAVQDGVQAACGCACIHEPRDVIDTNIPKVVRNEKGYAMYLSRQPIPYPKGVMNFPYLYQVCVYAFHPRMLRWFINTSRGFIEEAESIGLIRFIEHNIPVKMVKVPPSPISVDTPADLKRAREYYEAHRV